MNVSEVPQDPLAFKDRDKLRKLVYALDKDGKYTGVNSAGWEAENTAMKQAWEEADELLKETLEKIKNGALSPLAYFMQKNLMDVSLLSSYAGKWKWTVRKHLKPSGFDKLSDKMLEQYAAIFKVSVDELKNFNKEK